MLPYWPKLRQPARDLRRDMTDAETKLWFHLRKKQILGIQFYRQKPIGRFIVDFYAPKVKLVIEVDGAQHFEMAGIASDKERDATLKKLGLKVLRFDNLQILRETNSVLEAIQQTVQMQINRGD